MIGSIRYLLCGFSKIKIPNINEVQKDWNQYSHQYSTFDIGPQTFFYSLTSMLEFRKATNILEVACGTGKLLSFALQQKDKSAAYTASDLAPNMVSLAKNNLQNHFKRYHSKLTFEEWCNQQNINFCVLNAEQPIANSQPYDRIICNLALMITSDPLKLLKNLHQHAKPGCLFGVSVWGSKEKNTLMNCIRQSISESGFQLPKERSNFHLYQKVGGLAEKSGWEVVMNWEQNVLFPVLQYSPQRNKELFHYQINKLPSQQREKVLCTLQKNLKRVYQTKKGLNFDVELYVLRKK